MTLDRGFMFEGLDSGWNFIGTLGDNWNFDSDLKKLLINCVTANPDSTKCKKNLARDASLLCA